MLIIINKIKQLLSTTIYASLLYYNLIIKFGVLLP